MASCLHWAAGEKMCDVPSLPPGRRASTKDNGGGKARSREGAAGGGGGGGGRISVEVCVCVSSDGACGA